MAQGQVVGAGMGDVHIGGLGSLRLVSYAGNEREMKFSNIIYRTAPATLAMRSRPANIGQRPSARSSQ